MSRTISWKYNAQHLQAVSRNNPTEWAFEICEGELNLFDQLLGENDQDLYAWVTGQSPAEGVYAAMVDDIAENYWLLHQQPRSAWTQELDLRPWVEPW